MRKHAAMKFSSASTSETSSVLRRPSEELRELYVMGKELGRGYFGITYLCTEISTGNLYACKSISKRKFLYEDDRYDVEREVEIMHHLSGHPNVVTIKGAYEDSEFVHLVMEFCAGGDLFDRIVQLGYFTEKKAAQLTKTIVGVIEALHSFGVTHRDLKPENFLFASADEDAALKAIDFGLSDYCTRGFTFYEVVGSPYYVAPEVLCRNYGREVDVWSAGVILYMLLSGVPPFVGETEPGIFVQILEGKLDFESGPWPGISESAKDLVRKMLERNPKKRLTAHEVLCHPWILNGKVVPDKPLDSAVLSRLKEFCAMNKFKKMALRVVAETLSVEEIGGLKEFFKVFDQDLSGDITIEELKHGLKRLGSKLTDSEIKALMDSVDVDNSGTIDYGEFISATLHLKKIERGDQLFSAFSYFDKDGDGYITIDEIQQVCLEFGLADVQLDEMMKEFDEDNDGRFDYNEFVVMMQNSNGGIG